METIPLPDFRSQLPGLSRDERNLILDQARIVLEQNYVHLTDKRRLTLVDPVAACELLRANVATWGSSAEAELMFHEELLGVFRGIRDRHTSYLLPVPLATATAFLPFTVDIANDQGGEVAIVTELLPGLDAGPDFAPGIQVTHWNGVSIDRLLGLGLAGEMRGASATFSPRELTVRPLRAFAPPAEDWVMVGYLDATGRRCEARFEWRVLTGETASPGDLFVRSVAEAIDPGAWAAEASAANIGVHWSLLSADAAAVSGHARVVETCFWCVRPSICTHVRNVDPAGVRAPPAVCRGGVAGRGPGRRREGEHRR